MKGATLSFEYSKEIALLAFLAMFLFTFIAIGKRRSFFNLPPTKTPNSISLVLLLIACVISLLNPFWFFLYPYLSDFLLKRAISSITSETIIQLFPSAFILINLLLFQLFIGKKRRKAIWNPHSDPTFFSALRNILWGIVSIVIAYPLSLLFSHLTSIALNLFWGISDIPDQDAVNYIRQLLDHPQLIFLAVSVVSFIIPCVEEFLFRGLLQNWLKNYLRPYFSIGITSILFAFAHYSASQKLGNIPLLTSIFPLSLLLGLLYEKRGSLIASISLHATYNSMGLLQLLFLEKL